MGAVDITTPREARVVAILARELGCDPSKVLLEDAGSWLVEGPLKGVH